jgi:hypothetical protein
MHYNGTGNGWDFAQSMVVDDVCNVYVTGQSDGPGTDADYATVKYDSAGVEQWVARYNGPASSWDYAHGITVDDNGNVYVTGESWGDGTGYDCATVKYDNGGIEQWVARYNGPANSSDGGRALVVDNAGYVYVTGASTVVGTGYDYTTIEYSPTGIQAQNIISVKGKPFVTTIFREPLRLPEGKKCRVYDITGRIVEPDKIQPGIYFIEIDGVVTQKVVKVR